MKIKRKKASREEALTKMRAHLVDLGRKAMIQREVKQEVDEGKADLADAMDAASIDTFKASGEEGESYTATLVTPTRTTLDEEMIKPRLTPDQRKQLFKTVEVFDKKLFDEMLNAGDLSPEILIGASVEEPIKAYVKITGKQATQEEDA